MNEYLQVILLGIVQGVAEFLPISSSGHLVLVGQVLRWLGEGEGLAKGKDLEVVLHLGTLLAILVVYFPDLRRMVSKPALMAKIVVASVPAAVVGLTLEDWFDQAFDSPLVVGFGLLMTSLLLLTGQRLERALFDDQRLPWSCAVVIGCFQAVALVPGISRSGSTIAGGLLTGVDRISATRFSFLLAIPVTAGAVLLTVLKLVKSGETTLPIGPLAVGVVVSFVVGLLTLRWLIRLISQRKLHWFAGYCAAMGVVTIALSLTMGPREPSEPGKSVLLPEAASVAPLSPAP